MGVSNLITAKQVKENGVALLVIDVQQGLFEKSTPIYKEGQFLDNINLLVERAHQAKVPVIYIQHSGTKDLLRGTPKWRFHSRIHPGEGDRVVHKEEGNAFDGTGLEGMLKEMGIGRVVISGLVTHGCVKATCLGALKLGFGVVLVKDGHSNFSKQAGEIIEGTNKMMDEKGAELKQTLDVEF